MMVVVFVSARHFFQVRDDCFPRRRIQRGEGLVQKEHLRRDGEGPGKACPLGLAAGEGPGRAVAQVGDPEALQLGSTMRWPSAAPMPRIFSPEATLP